MPDPSNHLFEVRIDFDNIKENQIDLILPVWRPGRYVVFDFSSGIMDFSAYDNKSNPLKWKKIDKSTWRIQVNTLSGFYVTYKVYANEFDLRTRGLDEEHGFVNGTSVFMYSEEFRYLPLKLKVITGMLLPGLMHRMKNRIHS
jgi:predicted metalloprotease with PDZ domain